MKSALSLLFLVLLGVFIWIEDLLNMMPPSEFRYVSFLYLYQEKFEAVIEEAEKTDLDKIWWIEKYKNSPALIMPDGETQVKKYTDSIERVAESVGLRQVTMVKQDGGWAFLNDYSKKENGYYKSFYAHFGSEPSDEKCDDIIVGEVSPSTCHGSLFGDWYYIRYWTQL
jgi:hypothetical protein